MSEAYRTEYAAPFLLLESVISTIRRETTNNQNEIGDNISTRTILNPGHALSKPCLPLETNIQMETYTGNVLCFEQKEAL
jgi:hypothetical protein